MKKFNSLKELKNSKEFKEKDLSYCDVSNIDLSSIPSHVWCDFVFNHTDFRNTNIVFDPCALRENEYQTHIMEYCNFEGCDLSYIDSLYHTSIVGSNFLNTGLKVKLEKNGSTYSICLSDVIFSKEMESEVRKKVTDGLFDINTIAINPHIYFSSKEIYQLISENFLELNAYLTTRDIEKFSNLADIALEEDSKREGILYQLMQEVGTNFTKLDKIRFFEGLICNKKYDELDLISIPCDILEQFTFRDCDIKTLKLPEMEGDLGEKKIAFINSNSDNEHTMIPNLIIKDFTPTSWKSISGNRLGDTCFTFQTNLYLELGRKCNASCHFCRNNELPPCIYDFDAIKDYFSLINKYIKLKYVVVGGGEPTLYLKDLESLLKLYGKNKEFFILSNGSSGWEVLYDLAHYANIYISRHAISDEDNDKIFGIKTISAKDIETLKSYNHYGKKITLVATCFEGGLDTPEKLEDYIALSNYIHSDAVLFQNMHHDLSLNNGSNQIDEAIFDEVIAKLAEQGYIVGSVPIYSTGDYKLIIVKSRDETQAISFKKYITEDELKREWYKASKRTFDLSMAPNGNVYQNWHQKSELILSRSKSDGKN